MKKTGGRYYVIEDLINTVLLSIFIFAINLKDQGCLGSSVSWMSDPWSQLQDQSTSVSLQHKKTQETSRINTGALNTTEVLRKFPKFNDNGLKKKDFIYFLK